MPLSRNIVLLLCAGVVMMTSIGMNSFSMFLRPIEAEFGWSRTIATVPYMFGILGWGVGGVSLVNWPTIWAPAGDSCGILLMAAGFFGMGLSQNLWQLSLWYGILDGLEGSGRTRDHLAPGRQTLRSQSPWARC